MGIYVRFVYVSVEYNRGVEEMVGTSYYVTEEAGARLVAAGCMGDEELDWDNIRLTGRSWVQILTSARS